MEQVFTSRRLEQNARQRTLEVDGVTLLISEIKVRLDSSLYNTDTLELIQLIGET